MPPTPQQLRLQAAVNSSSSNLVIEAGIARIGMHNSSYPFIQLTNQILAPDCIPFFESYYSNQPSAIDLDQFTDYLLLSTSAHLFSGWSYLSQAASALLNGAKSQALHLAYYAELRAALSILAESGVCILNGKHFSVGLSGNVTWFEGGTHVATWEALETWAAIPNSIGKISSSISALGLTAQEWNEIFTNSSVIHSSVPQQWINKWSIDLLEDRKLRNIASYRPNLQNNAFELLKDADVSFICDITQSFQPNNGYFESIDTAIIFHLAKKTAEANANGSFTRKVRRKFWSNACNNLINLKGKSNAEAQILLSALQNAQNSIGFQLLRDAEPSKKEPKSVFSRALFLLRLASALVNKQWQEIHLQRNLSGHPNSLNWQNEILFEYSKSSNVWFDITNPPISNDYTILFEDQYDASDQVKDWLETEVFNIDRLWKENAFSLFQLCRLDRLGLIAVSA